MMIKFLVLLLPWYLVYFQNTFHKVLRSFDKKGIWKLNKQKKISDS